MTAATAYKPRAGSVAERAIAHLIEHGPTAGVPLAEAIEADREALAPSLSTAMQFGAVKREKRDALWWYEIGDGTPQVRNEEPDDLPIMQLVVPATNTPKARSTVIRARDAVTATEACDGAGAELPSRIAGIRKASSESAQDGGKELGSLHAEERRDPPPGLRIALWSDGTLEIRRDADDLVLFTKDETRELVDYLDGMLLPRSEAHS